MTATILPPAPGYTQILDVVDAAYRLVRGPKDGNAITALDRENGVFALRMMLDTWSVEGLMVPSVVREQFALCCGQVSYLMGPGGDWDTVRPIEILDIRVLFGGIDVPVPVVGYDDYAAVALKNLMVDPPRLAWPDNNYPLQKITFYPIPNSALTITLVSEKPLAEIQGIFDSAAFPPGYLEALTYNLALRLGDEKASTARVAEDCRRFIKARNVRPVTMAVDPALRSRGGGARYNVFSDQGW